MDLFEDMPVQPKPPLAAARERFAKAKAAYDRAWGFQDVSGEPVSSECEREYHEARANLEAEEAAEYDRLKRARQRTLP